MKGMKKVKVEITKEDLKDDNVYFSNEASWQYWSNSLFRNFLDCEARSLAEIKKEWSKKWDELPLIVGNYVHSYFESEKAHEEFLEKHEDYLYKKASKASYQKAIDDVGGEYKASDTIKDLKDKIEELNNSGHEVENVKGELYQDFIVADQMIDRIKDDPLFNHFWQGEKEVVVTGELYGHEWKGKIDCLNVDKGYFIDLKTNQNPHMRYYDVERGQYVSFVESFGYSMQVALYEELLEMEYGKPFVGYIFAVSKEKPSNFLPIEIPVYEKRFQLEKIQMNIDHVEKVKVGEVEPRYCNRCEYCREYRPVEEFITPDKLIK